MYIAVPNAIGWCFALLQILLRVCIPARNDYDTLPRGGDVEGMAAGGGSGERKRMVDGRPLAD